MEVINFSVKFVDQSNSGAITGDINGIISGLLIIAIIIALSIICKYNEKISFNKYLNAGIFSVLLISSGFFFAGKAFAESQQGPLVPDKNEIIASINSDNTIEFSSCNIQNVADLTYIVDTSSVSIDNEVKDVDALLKTSFELRGFDGTLFKGSPTGESQIPVNVKNLEAGASTQLSFYIENLDINIAKQLNNKKVFNINLTQKNSFPLVSGNVFYEKHNVKQESDDIGGTKVSAYRNNGGLIDEVLADDDGNYTLEIVNYNQDENIKVEAINPNWLYTSYSSVIPSIVDPSVPYILNCPLYQLDKYSWEEIKKAANDFSQKGKGKESTSEFWKEFSTFANQGSVKHVDLTNQDSAYVRIIDFNHDRISNSALYSGMTFIFVNAINQPIYTGFTMDSTGNNYACGWQYKNCTDKEKPEYEIVSSPFRNKFQADGAYYSLIPNELQNLINKVDKSSNIGWFNDYSSGRATLVFDPTIYTSSDSLFILSNNELGGNWCEEGKKEGTKYTYISNDSFQKIFPNRNFSAQVLSCLNVDGFRLIMNNAEGEVWEQPINAWTYAFLNGGTVDCEYAGGTWTRSSYIDHQSFYSVCNSNGDASITTPIYNTSTICPAFCL